VTELIGVVGALALVLGLAWLSIRALKSLQVGAAGPGVAQELRFVRALPIGRQERLVVVAWRGETLLLGVTAGGISLLDRRPEPGEGAAPGGAPAPEAGSTADSTSGLATLLLRRPRARPEGPALDAPILAAPRDKSPHRANPS